MRRAKQISVFMENRPGTIGMVLKAFGDAGINLRALTVSDTVDHAVVRMVVAEVDKALSILEDANMLCLVHDVLEIKLEDQPGTFLRFTQKLADAKINVHYAYGSSSNGGDATIYLRVSDIDGAEKLSDAPAPKSGGKGKKK